MAVAALPAQAGTAKAQELRGELALSYGTAPSFSTDDDEERLSEMGYQASGWAGVSLENWKVFGDLNIFHRRTGDNDFDSYAPEGARSYGVHFGRKMGQIYAGAFLDRNQFQSEYRESGNYYVSGKLYGLEGQYHIGSTTLFAQLGRAEMVGDEDDVAFIGTFQRIGALMSVDKFTLTADIENGRSPNIFEDDGDYGNYPTVGVSVDYQFSDRFIGILSYRNMDVVANTEDNGFDDFYGVGMRIPLGATAGKRNNLATSYSPGLAAAWASNLD